MAALVSGARLAASRRIVVKIGSALLVDVETGRLRIDWLEGLAADVAELRARGKDVILVSSGSIALGRRALRLRDGALSLEQSQAAAAVGQIRLAQAYETVLAPHGLTTAQVLVTLEDSENRRRYLNSRRTLGTLIDLGAVPIVNENDTVATDEIRYGDNDRLAAQVASMAGAGKEDLNSVVASGDSAREFGEELQLRSSRSDIDKDPLPDRRVRSSGRRDAAHEELGPERCQQRCGDDR
jgi:glutamate 5-kinase